MCRSCRRLRSFDFCFQDLEIAASGSSYRGRLASAVAHLHHVMTGRHTKPVQNQARLRQDVSTASSCTNLSSPHY
ncbi:hypothetical protein EAH74_05730 [Pseudomonas mandelii]|uniref:Uncharacterized protein n=1 Tax=Pseudomonas mandelii TaxID=75612 RepID=A0A502IJ28_9PSED|nr:hypothetical protein EAH74_05730 [Pseudomonas mandelii]